MNNNDIIGSKSGKLVCIPTYDAIGGESSLTLHIAAGDAAKEFETITGEAVDTSLSYVRYKGWSITVKVNH